MRVGHERQEQYKTTAITAQDSANCQSQDLLQMLRLTIVALPCSTRVSAGCGATHRIRHAVEAASLAGPLPPAEQKLLSCRDHLTANGAPRSRSPTRPAAHNMLHGEDCINGLLNGVHCPHSRPRCRLQQFAAVCRHARSQAYSFCIMSQNVQEWHDRDGSQSLN